MGLARRLSIICDVMILIFCFLEVTSITAIQSIPLVGLSLGFNIVISFVTGQPFASPMTMMWVMGMFGVRAASDLGFEVMLMVGIDIQSST